MKYLIAILFAAAPLVAARAQEGLRPAGANEVLLQIKATGENISPADSATISAIIETKSDNIASARAVNEAKFNAIMAAVRKAGVPQSVRIVDNVAQYGFVGNEVLDPDEMLAAQMGGGAPAQKSKVVRNSISVIGVDPKTVGRVRDAMEGEGATIAGPTAYSLKSQDAAQAAARGDAIAKARAEADAYADGLGMRISRMIRFSNTAPGGSFDYSDMTKLMSGSQAVSAEYVRTSIAVWVDYAMVPK